MRTALRILLVLIVLRLMLPALYHATEAFLLQLLDVGSKVLTAFESPTSF